jgi:hypothetical protein
MTSIHRNGSTSSALWRGKSGNNRRRLRMIKVLERIIKKRDAWLSNENRYEPQPVVFLTKKEMWILVSEIVVSSRNYNNAFHFANGTTDSLIFGGVIVMEERNG